MHLQKAFGNNGYPNFLFEKLLNRYLKKFNYYRSTL